MLSKDANRMRLTHSILLTGPSGAGKSSFANKSLRSEGSGLVLASPIDELDSYLGLEPPSYLLKAIDDQDYLPSAEQDRRGSPLGLTTGVRWLRDRYGEVKSDAEAGKPSRYAVLVLDTVSAVGSLAQNAA